MHPDPIIQVEGLGKRYTLGTQSSERYVALRDVITNYARKLFRRGREADTRTSDAKFWALQDVSFEIGRGEVVGIIGRNGAGKSTLLKILSRITEPTTGKITLKGRVASLLEVGTGFHPELTGRENIFLNGAILGMHRSEIRAKFDEIVAFAEVEKFLDTPVKRYSSGMYVRLAFAVAAHLESEILIVDEVLAVGDAEFQKKCLGKMENIAVSTGRTVLFVSHQMNAVQALCARCILMRNGRLESSGTPAEVISTYLRAGGTEASWQEPADRSTPYDNPYFRPSRFELRDSQGATLARTVEAHETLEILIEGHTQTTDPTLVVGFALYSADGQLLFWSLQTDTAPKDWPKIGFGHNRLRTRLPAHLLNEGDYRIELIVSLHCRAWLCQPGINSPSITLQVRGGLSDSPYWMMARPGLLGPILRFDLLAGGTDVEPPRPPTPLATCP